VKLKTSQVDLLMAIIVLCSGWSSPAVWSQNTKEGKDVKTTRIAMCQIVALDGDKEGNFFRIEHALREAQAQKADIACFPETTLLGWVNPDAHKQAQPIPGKDSDRLCALAKKYDMYISVGLAEKENDTLYDSMVLIDNQGTILLKHRKINILTELMTPPYTPGESVSAVDTAYGRIGLLICADTFLDGCLSQMKAQEPDLLLAPYGWAAAEGSWPGHGKQLENTVRNAAQVIGCPLVGTDLVGSITHGPWAGMVYGGQSVASDAHGKILGRCADRDRDIQIVSIERKNK
jgi:predicted amidohydrolase